VGSASVILLAETISLWQSWAALALWPWLAIPGQPQKARAEAGMPAGDSESAGILPATARVVDNVVFVDFRRTGASARSAR
jgi:hypothetical protein